MSGIIQVAGIRNAAEAELLVASGVDWLGFPFRLDFHSEDLDEATAKAIIADLPPSVTPVLITYLNEVDAVLELNGFLGTRIVQLHGRVSSALGEGLKSRAPSLSLIRSLVIGADPVAALEEEMVAWSPWVDYFLTDSFDPKSGARGATGKTHDWELSRRLAERAPKPLILAGGLTPDNVAAAIRQVGPAGVDVHTGVEDAFGRKDPNLVKAFVAAARKAWA